ncbi:MAG TPA: EamA family transporter, partial [Alphaproteobacteria bacterium]|nr:EamA family transporter [Alphaproteobacteria bacterium]
DALRLLVIGILLLSVGNIAVLWAEEYVPSGLTALIVAIVPIWVAVIEAWIFRSARLPALGIVGLGLGIAGMALLLWPQISSKTHLGRQELFATVVLAFGALAWALGSVFSSRWTLTVDVFVSAAWQMTLGGLVNALVALATGEFTRTVWSAPAITGIVYLVICGSWIGFTAYIWLLEHVPTPKVATYAYVNPIVAVFLGWLLLKERVDAYMIVGTAVIVAAVALVNGSKLRRGRVASGSELEPAPISAAGAVAD